MSNYNAAQVGALVKEFMRGGTCNEIAQRTGFSPETVRRYTRVWHRAGLVYVDRYKRDASFKPLKVWRLNVDGWPDAQRPAPMTSEERCARYRMKRQKKAVRQMKYQLARSAA